MRKFFIAVLIIFLFNTSIAQKQANIWHFGIGNALDFSSGVPLNITGSSIFAPEGSASYCDKYGHFLFYTNGGGREALSGQDEGHIWNRNNAVMYNMLGTEGGGWSSSQSAVIFEAPGPDSVYYVFTMDEGEYYVGASPAIQALQPLGRGLSYFTVDMRLNSGLGAVVLANQTVKIPSAEGLCAIRHSNKKDYWVLINEEAMGISVYSVTNSGVNFSAVYPFASSSIIKGAPNGLKVYGSSQILDFNNSTGQLSNPISLPNAGFCEFSPNSRFLYSYEGGLFGPNDVVRYDLHSSNINNSATVIGTSLSGYGQMQLAPDGKIYFISGNNATREINRINCPNTFSASVEPGLFNYQTIDYDFIGLPNFPGWLFENYDSTFVSLGPDTISLCDVGGSYELNAGNPGASYIWSTGDTTQKITVSTPGIYDVTVNGTCGIGKDKVVVISCNSTSNNNCIVFQATGAIQQWIVPAGVDSIHLKMWGAAGGGGPDLLNNGGGGGGFTGFTMAVSEGQIFDITVGTGGIQATGQLGGLGGWPNGGKGGSGNRTETIAGSLTDVGGSGGGGGRTEIKSNGVLLAIAGGGGGGTYNRYGGGGGGINAEYATAANPFDVFGFGGTQTGGGAPGANTLCTPLVFGQTGLAFKGGDGATDFTASSTSGGGGGDGYYGGGGGSSHGTCFDVGSAGGGGSGYLCSTCPGLSGVTKTAGIFVFVPMMMTLC